jgi:hypothetical protein
VKKIVSFVKWVAVMLGFMLALWLPLVASVHYLEKKLAAAQPSETAWFSGTEGLRLMRYHGTNGLKITGDRVYIWRDSKWIEVLKRKPA